MAKAKNVQLGIQSGTDRTVYATWTWNVQNTAGYVIRWSYATGDGVWFKGNSETVTAKQAVYSAPSNATGVLFIVTPVAKTRTVNNKEVAYWTAQASTAVTYTFSSNKKPEKPSTPSGSINKYKLTAEVTTYDVNATAIQFQIVQDDKKVFASYVTEVNKAHAAHVFNVTAGHVYKIRCRGAYNKSVKRIRSKKDTNLYGPWSEYSNNFQTPPAAPGRFTKHVLLSDNVVQISWNPVATAKNYIVAYTTNASYFDSNPSEVRTVTIDATKATHAEITGLEMGTRYYFHLKASNDAGESDWNDNNPNKKNRQSYGISIGTVPDAPTVWSESNTVVTGDDAILHWQHNSADGSLQGSAIVEVTINGETTQTIYSGQQAQTNFHIVNTSEYVSGTTINWRVTTKGIAGIGFGPYSETRTVTVYSAPTLDITINEQDGADLESITQYPINVHGEANPSNQHAVSYTVNIVSLDRYDNSDWIGRPIVVSEGESIYSNTFNADENEFDLAISAGDVNLVNNMHYRMISTVAMDSGMTDQNEIDFEVSWAEDEFEPLAEIIIEDDVLSAYIRPYCEDEEGNLIENLLLSVYRREYDGQFTEIATGLENNGYITITDPHPSLDFARYRIVAISTETGTIGWTDMPGIPVEEPAIIIQWDEQWVEFDSDPNDIYNLDEPTYAGSFLRLPYNVDVQDDYDKDVALVNYIGRSHPVSYYGTQLGISATWNCEIDKEDIDTLYALRRLAIYRGDAYVREPSGSGYWAQIKVSFSQTHRAVTIPVSLALTRVSGGA